MRVWLAVSLLLLSGCASDPPLERPVAVDDEGLTQADAGGPGRGDPDVTDPASATDGAAEGGDGPTNGTAQEAGAPENGTSGADNGTNAPDDGAQENGTNAPDGGAQENGTSPDNGTTPHPPPENGTQPQEPAVGQRLLEVSVFDYTYWAWDAPKGVEVDVVDFGTWVPDMQYDSAGPHPMGRHDVGRLHENGLTVYTDGRNGPACTVHFEVTAEMEDESFDAITQVEIYEDTVHIYGMAIPNYPDWEHPYICGR